MAGGVRDVGRGMWSGSEAARVQDVGEFSTGSVSDWRIAMITLRMYVAADG